MFLKALIITQVVASFRFVWNLEVLRRVHKCALFNELQKNVIYRHSYHSVHIYTEASHETIGSLNLHIAVTLISFNQ
jgi:hypothetical protein